MKRDDKFIRRAMQLYLVTDQTWVITSLYEDVEKALEGGVTCVQIREKNLSQDIYIQEAKSLKKLCKKYHVPFIVNDNVDVALMMGADGVHVGQSDACAHDVRVRIGNDKILGVSVQNVEQAIKAQSDGADYLGVGAMFSTTTKLDAQTVSHEELKKICETVTIPVVAIGGINEQNLVKLSDSHVDGIAVVSAILASSHITKTTQKLLQTVQEKLL